MSEILDPGLWVKIAEDPLPTGVVMRRVRPDLPHDVFIGESRPNRNRMLQLSVLGVPNNMPTKWRQSKGLEIIVDSSQSSRTKIRLRSLTKLGDPLFTELAVDVIGTLAAFPGADAATRVIERVIAWQEFFARRGESFSQERAAGLFGELTLLRAHFVPELGKVASVYGWTGPDPAIQDFQFGDAAVEVKTYRGAGAGQMKISSERQLEHVGVTELYLGYIALDQRQDGTGMTLLDLIDDVRSILSESPASLHLFEGKLISYGWADSHSEYRDELYEVRVLEYFLVADAFPRIVTSDLPTGVSNVSYVLDRSALTPYLIDHDAVLAHLRTTK